MNHSGLIERTARAIYRTDAQAHKGIRSDYDSLSATEQMYYEKLAKVAQAELLREPVVA